MMHQKAKFPFTFISEANCQVSKQKREAVRAVR